MAMRVTIALKIFGIALGLLVLMTVVALLNMRMTRTVDDRLVIIDRNYFPGYVALAQANIRSIEESAYVRRLLFAINETPDNLTKLNDLRQRIANASKASDEQIAAARSEMRRLAGVKGSRREMTILFCDMEGFTTLSEGLTRPLWSPC